MQMDDDNYYLIDVQARGAYPAFALRRFEREGIEIPWEKGDAELLAENTVDFVSFSYYSSRMTLLLRAHVLPNHVDGILEIRSLVDGRNVFLGIKTRYKRTPFVRRKIYTGHICIREITTNPQRRVRRNVEHDAASLRPSGTDVLGVALKHILGSCGTEKPQILHQLTRKGKIIRALEPHRLTMMSGIS